MGVGSRLERRWAGGTWPPLRARAGAAHGVPVLMSAGLGWRVGCGQRYLPGHLVWVRTGHVACLQPLQVGEEECGPQKGPNDSHSQCPAANATGSGRSACSLHRDREAVRCLGLRAPLSWDRGPQACSAHLGSAGLPDPDQSAAKGPTPGRRNAGPRQRCGAHGSTQGSASTCFMWEIDTFRPPVPAPDSGWWGLQVPASQPQT